MSSAWEKWITQVSAYAGELDILVAAFAILIFLLSAPVFVFITVFAVKYRRGKPADRSGKINQRVGLEISWALVPFLLLLVFYVWATQMFFELQRPPEGALEIDVVAKQWMWKFQHPGGQREINELHVPAGQAVKLTMASQDVIHSLFVPALRLKQDVVPGRYTSMWFTADKTGRYALTCAEFCGTEHARMGGEIVVMAPDDFARWLAGTDADGTLAQQGAALFRSQGCSGCHSPQATVHAPPLAGLYGSAVPLENGSVVTADSQYIRDSILLPQAAIAAGYPDIMPTFENILSEEQVLQLVAYIKSLESQAGSRPDE